MSAPGVVAVTSAVRGDGKSLVAAGLAYGLASVGHRVLLVDGNASAAGAGNAGSAPKLDARPEFDILAYVSEGTKGEPARLGLSGPGVLASCTGETVRTTFARLREEFAYTVVDTAVLVESGMALVLATEANAVVIAFKQGRGAHEADREFVKVLKAAQTPVLGVVTTQPKAIREFSQSIVPTGRRTAFRRRSTEDASKASPSARVRV